MGHHQGIRSCRAIAFILHSYFAQRTDRSSAHLEVKKEGTKTQHCSILRSYILKQQQHSPLHTAHRIRYHTGHASRQSGKFSSLCALYSLGFRMFSSFTMSAANARMPSESFSVAIASSFSA
jgi:predicted small secreted protein